MTRISTVLAGRAGVMIVIWVSLLTVMLPAATAVTPMTTAVVPVKPVPVMTTVVPPSELPDTGLTPVMAGPAMGTRWRLPRFS